MAKVYKFQISLPVIDLLPRNRYTNVVHMEHVTGLLGTDLDAICGDLAAMYQGHYGKTSEVHVKAYDVGPPPNNPIGEAVVNAGTVWTCAHPTEIALCLSFAGDNRGDKRRRGRVYLMPQLSASFTGAIDAVRPSAGMMDWALQFYTQSNSSFPDIGGVDMKFGIWSTVGSHFTQSTQAWVNDEWDAQRRRGLRETTRVSATREG